MVRVLYSFVQRRPWLPRSTNLLYRRPPKYYRKYLGYTGIHLHCYPLSSLLTIKLFPSWIIHLLLHVHDNECQFSLSHDPSSTALELMSVSSCSSLCHPVNWQLANWLLLCCYLWHVANCQSSLDAIIITARRTAHPYLPPSGTLTRKFRFKVRWEKYYCRVETFFLHIWLMHGGKDDVHASVRLYSP